jgi:tetratricopeptide (TPR) repeat protein
MKWLRTLVALLAVASSAASAWRLVLPRYGCNRDKGIVNSWTIRLSSGPADYERTTKAQELAEMCRVCLEHFPNDYELHYLLAANEAFLGDDEGAERSYRRSIALNERPESLANLAVLQLVQGRTEEARGNLYHAALFNMAVVALVSEPLRSDVTNAVIDRHKRLGSDGSVAQWRNRRRRDPRRGLPVQ